MMYEDLSSTYDHFVNWKNRLNFELPFLERQFGGIQTGGSPLRILDAACGTAMHAIEFARRGYTAAGADLSAGMITQAKQNVQAAGVNVDLRQAGFGSIAPTFGTNVFDAVVCLGNSLPHVNSLAELDAALTDFAASIKPGGRLILQNRNFDAVLARQERFMDPQSYRHEDEEEIFLRFYDFRADGLLDFQMVTLTRQADGWQQKLSSSVLYPLQRAEVEASLQRAGFADIQSFGGLNGSAFDAAASPNLVVVAQKPA